MEITIEEIAEMDSQNPTFERSYQYTKTIASGSFGIVKSATDKSTGKTVAVKIVDKNCIHSSDIAKIKREVTILKQLNHPNIINFINYSETNTKIFIVTEYIKDGTLRNWLDKHYKLNTIDDSNNNIDAKVTVPSIPITEELIAEIIFYLLIGVSYIHSLDICHKDIKPENVMFDNADDFSSLKLVDFGLSTQGNERNDCSGTLLYMAPELFGKNTHSSSYTKEVDIWGVGIITSMLLNKSQHPFYYKGLKKAKYFQVIKKGYVYNSNVSLMANDFLGKMLHPELNKRYTAFNALNHPWITREILASIPLTIHEKLKRKSIVQKLRDLFIVTVILKKLYNDEQVDKDINEDIQLKWGDKDYNDYLYQLALSSKNQNKQFNIKRQHAFEKGQYFYKDADKIKGLILQNAIEVNDKERSNVQKNKDKEIEMVIDRDNDNDIIDNKKISVSPKKRRNKGLSSIFLVSPHSRNEVEKITKKATDNFRMSNKNNLMINNITLVKQKELIASPSLSLFKLKTNREMSNKPKHKENKDNNNSNITINPIQSKNSFSSQRSYIKSKELIKSNAKVKSNREYNNSLKHLNSNRNRNNLKFDSPLNQRAKQVQIQTTNSSTQIKKINSNNNNHPNSNNNNDIKASPRIHNPLSKSAKKPSLHNFQIKKKDMMNVNVIQMKLLNAILPKLS